MPVYMVRCNFLDPDRSRPAVDAALDQLDETLRPLPDTWLVEGATSSGLIWESLKTHLAPADRVLILRIGEEGVWHNLPEAMEHWLGERMTRTQ